MYKTSKKKFGEYIKKVREEKGLSREELANKLFVTEGAVWKWENGKRYPDFETVGNLARELGISTQDIYDNSLEEKSGANVIGIISIIFLLGALATGIALGVLHIHKGEPIYSKGFLSDICDAENVDSFSGSISHDSLRAVNRKEQIEQIYNILDSAMVVEVKPDEADKLEPPPGGVAGVAVHLQISTKDKKHIQIYIDDYHLTYPVIVMIMEPDGKIDFKCFKTDEQLHSQLREILLTCEIINEEVSDVETITMKQIKEVIKSIDVTSEAFVVKGNRYVTDLIYEQTGVTGDEVGSGSYIVRYYLNKDKSEVVEVYEGTDITYWYNNFNSSEKLWEYKFSYESYMKNMRDQIDLALNSYVDSERNEDKFSYQGCIFSGYTYRVDRLARVSFYWENNENMTEEAQMHLMKLGLKWQGIEKINYVSDGILTGDYEATFKTSEECYTADVYYEKTSMHIIVEFYGPDNNIYQFRGEGYATKVEDLAELVKFKNATIEYTGVGLENENINDIYGESPKDTYITLLKNQVIQTDEDIECYEPCIKLWFSDDVWVDVMQPKDARYQEIEQAVIVWNRDGETKKYKSVKRLDYSPYSS